MTCDLQSLNWELKDLKSPTPRDRLIFEEVLVKGRGQLEVAQEQGISQPRVSKILVEVGAWLCRVLPESLAKERPEGQLALGCWLAEARLDHLYQRALEGYDASGQDKVRVKQGKRGDVPWEEICSTTQTRQAGFINSALRAVLAKHRLTTATAKGIDRVRRASPVSPVKCDESPVMSNSAKTEEFSPSERPQTQAAHGVSNSNGRSPENREEMLQTVIKLLRESPQRAHWTDADFRDAAQRRLAILDAAHRENEEKQRREEEGRTAQGTARATQESESIVETTEPQPSPRLHEQASISLDAARMEKLRREREKRKRPEQRRREFLAPLAAG